MVTDDEMEALPEDPELAFVAFEQILRQRVADAIEARENSRIDDLCIDYISRVLAAKKAFGLDVLNDWQVPTLEGNVWQSYTTFKSDVDHYTTEIRLRRARRAREFSVAFDAAAKERLRHLLEEMLKIVDRLEVDTARKEALYARIDALAKEVNRDRTRFEAYAALVITACERGDEAVGKLRHLRRFIELIGNTFGKAKRQEDDASKRLPPRQEPKKIDPPRKALPKARQAADDIPF